MCHILPSPAEKENHTHSQVRFVWSCKINSTCLTFGHIYLSAYQVKTEKSSMSWNFLLLHFVYSVGVHVCRCVVTHTMTCGWRPEDNLLELVVSSSHMDPGNEIPIFRSTGRSSLHWLFSSIFICAYMFLGVQATCTCGCQQNPERPLALLKLDLRAIMSQLTWALGDGTGRPLGEQEALLTSETSPQPRAIPASVMISARRFSRDLVHVFSTASA